MDAIRCDRKLQIIRFVRCWCIRINGHNQVADTETNGVILGGELDIYRNAEPPKIIWRDTCGCCGRWCRSVIRYPNGDTAIPHIADIDAARRIKTNAIWIPEVGFCRPLCTKL